MQQDVETDQHFDVRQYGRELHDGQGRLYHFVASGVCQVAYAHADFEYVCRERPRSGLRGRLVLHRRTEPLENCRADGGDVRPGIQFPSCDDRCRYGQPRPDLSRNRVAVEADHNVHDKAVREPRALNVNADCAGFPP